MERKAGAREEGLVEEERAAAATGEAGMVAARAVVVPRG